MYLIISMFRFIRGVPCGKMERLLSAYDCALTITVFFKKA